MYSIELSSLAVDHLDAVRPFDRARILDEIEKHLSDQPSRTTRRKKIIEGLEPPWDQAPPVWQLRVGDYRVFYDVEKTARRVTIHAILHKGRKTTGDVL